jgi:reactive intermediate/imine deaminase
VTTMSDPTNGERVRTSRSNPTTIAPPIGSYSHAVRVETAECVWLYVSGQIANDAEGTLVGIGDLRAQTEQVFENLARVLQANDAAFEHVVKIQTYFTTLEDLAGSREVRSRYLPADPPASTAVQVAALVVPEALIEVDVVAAVPVGVRT